jgi:hypothetical protein
MDTFGLDFLEVRKLKIKFFDVVLDDFDVFWLFQAEVWRRRMGLVMSGFP